jgi:hypothetical protein
MRAYSLLLPLVVDVTEEVEHEEFAKVEVELLVELVVLVPFVPEPEVDEVTDVEDDDGAVVRVT